MTILSLRSNYNQPLTINLQIPHHEWASHLNPHRPREFGPALRGFSMTFTWYKHGRFLGRICGLVFVYYCWFWQVYVYDTFSVLGCLCLAAYESPQHSLTLIQQRSPVLKVTSTWFAFLWITYQQISPNINMVSATIFCPSLISISFQLKKESFSKYQYPVS